MLGDFNVAPDDRDVWDPKAFVGSTHVTEPERDAVARSSRSGAWKTRSAASTRRPDRLYSYWDYRAGDFHQHRGMRIDLVLATRPVAERVTWAVRRPQRPQGHAAVRPRAGDRRPRRLDLPLPCANSSARRASAGTPVLERREVRVVARARLEARVRALHHARELEQPEHAVERDVATGRESESRRVPLERARRASGCRRRPANGVTPASDAASFARFDPQAEHPTEVDERVTDGRLLPVDHRDELDREMRREHHVVELVVAVDDTPAAASAAYATGQPRRRVVDLGQRTRLVLARAARASAAPGVRGTRRDGRTRRARPPASRTRGCPRARRRARTRSARAAPGSAASTSGSFSRTTTPSTTCHEIEGRADHVDVGAQRDRVGHRDRRARASPRIVEGGAARGTRAPCRARSATTACAAAGAARRRDRRARRGTPRSSGPS